MVRIGKQGCRSGLRGRLKFEMAKRGRFGCASGSWVRCDQMTLSLTYLLSDRDHQILLLEIDIFLWRYHHD